MASQLEALERLAGSVAAALSQDGGDVWRVDPDHESSWEVMLAGPDGQALLLEGGLAARVYVRGVYPSGPVGRIRTGNVEIGVSGARGSETIAREIRCRLLPRYRAELARVRDVIVGQIEAATGQAATEAHLSGLANVETWGSDSMALRVPGRGHLSIRFRVTEGGRSIIIDRGGWIDFDTWARMLAAAAPPEDVADQAAIGNGSASAAVGEAEIHEADQACVQCGAVLSNAGDYARPHQRGDRPGVPCRFVRFFDVRFLESDVVDGDRPMDDVRQDLADCSPDEVAQDAAEELAEELWGPPNQAGGGERPGELCQEQWWSVVAAARALADRYLVFEGGHWFVDPDGSSILDYATGQRSEVTGHPYGFTDIEQAAVAGRLNAITGRPGRS